MKEKEKKEHGDIIQRVDGLVFSVFDTFRRLDWIERAVEARMIDDFREIKQERTSATTGIVSATFQPHQSGWEMLLPYKSGMVWNQFVITLLNIDWACSSLQDCWFIYYMGLAERSKVVWGFSPFQPVTCSHAIWWRCVDVTGLTFLKLIVCCKNWSIVNFFFCLLV